MKRKTYKNIMIYFVLMEFSLFFKLIENKSEITRLALNFSFF